MSALTKIRMGLLLAKIKLGSVFTMDWEKDPNPENWRTINGSHVHLENGKINGGAGGKFAGNDWVGKKMHASDPRAQQGTLFGQYNWTVEPSRTEKEAKTNRENLKKEVDMYNDLNSGKRDTPFAKLEAQEKKVFEQLKNFPKESKEYKDAIKSLGWAEADVQELERTEQERQAKYKRDWEKAMAENEAAAKQKGASNNTPKRIEAISQETGYKIKAELLPNGNIKWGDKIWDKERGGMEAFINRLHEKGYDVTSVGENGEKTPVYIGGEPSRHAEVTKEMSRSRGEQRAKKWFEREENNRLGMDMPGYSREDDIRNTYNRAIEYRNRLTAIAASVNSEIDRINRKRKPTKEDEATLKQLNTKRMNAENADTAFRAELEKFKQKYGISEQYGAGIGFKVDPKTGEMVRSTAKPLPGQARETTVTVGNVSGQQPEEKQYYSPLEAVAKLREMRKAKNAANKPATEKPKSTAPKKKGNARTRLEDVAKEVGINLEEYRTAGGKYDKRNSQNIKFEDMPKEKADAFKQALRDKGYTLSWNGGLGTAVKEPQERKATANYKPTEKTAAPEGYDDYLKRKNSGQKNNYEESQEARRERYENRSAAASKESKERFNAAREIQSNIPLGQPILVGHHSEARHRADLNRIENNMNKAFEASKKADYYSQRAESVGSAGISSLDPDAKYKVYEKLRDLENLQDKMKEANAKSPNAKPYASYQLVNNSAEIRRLKKRLEDLSKASTTEGSSLTENGLYSLKQEEGRYQFKFDGKPSDEVRSILKSNGFKWSPSRGTWVRSAAGSGSYAMERVKKALEPFVS